MPLAEHEVYDISTDRFDKLVVWRMIDLPSDDWAAFATELEKKGCGSQLETLLEAGDTRDKP